MYVREREKQAALPTSITTDEKKINFTFNLPPTADIADAVKKFTDGEMGLCEKARRKKKVKIAVESVRLTIKSQALIIKM